jgi:hypothetical protein
MWAWFAIPWVRKLAEVALLLAAIAAVVHGIYHAGRNDGIKSESGKETEAGRAQFEQLTKTFQDQLSAGAAREQRLGELATKFADVAAAANTRTLAASSADAAKVKAIPDSAIKNDLMTKAGGSLDDIAVLRHVDDVVTDYPHKVEENAAQRDEIAAVNQRIDAVLAQLANAQGERDAAIGAFNHLVSLYTQAYNAAIDGHRKWYCLFLCKPKRTLNLPAPVSIALAAKKAAK